ncbi:MAG: hypothetical protein IT336_10075 [Thermomicrobiales bacterium]|nr:hypothetical protein [Thermomicrobiales bacterium]
MNRHTSGSGSHQLMATWRGCRTTSDTGSLADPFAVNPIRRSSGLVVVCVAIVVVPWLIGDAVATTVMLSVGWLAVTGLVMGVPVLIWSLIEAGVLLLRRRMHPPVDVLDISPRLTHILQRHGFDTIERVDAAPDAALLLLSNMDARGVRDIRRAVAVWRYRRWQEQGYPVEGR